MWILAGICLEDTHYIITVDEVNTVLGRSSKVIRTTSPELHIPFLYHPRHVCLWWRNRTTFCCFQAVSGSAMIQRGWSTQDKFLASNSLYSKREPGNLPLLQYFCGPKNIRQEKQYKTTYNKWETFSAKICTENFTVMFSKCCWFPFNSSCLNLNFPRDAKNVS